MIPLGLSAAASTVVGNAIGANEIKLAKEFASVSVCCLFGAESIISPCILLFGSYFVSLFSEDPIVEQITRRGIPYIAVFTLVDGLSAVLSGILRGAGKQHWGAYGNIVAYYSCGLPLAWTLCFDTNLGVVGLLVGIAIAPLLTDSFMSFMIFCRSEQMFQASAVSKSAGNEPTPTYAVIRTTDIEEYFKKGEDEENCHCNIYTISTETNDR